MSNHQRDFVNDVYLSADPEFFIWDPEDEMIVPSDEILPKQGNPVTDGVTKSNARLYTDGVQAEFNLRKKTCRHHVIEKLTAAHSLIDSKIPNELEVKYTPAVELPEDQVMFLSDFARQLGCDPSRNAWMRGEEMDMPYGEESPTRYAGGHIHMGKYRDGPPNLFIDDHDNVIEIIKVADHIVGLPFTQMFGGEASALRRQAYGKAGEYRYKDYGLEYRVLGPQWAEFVPLVGPVFGWFREALNIVYSGEQNQLYDLVDQVDVIDAINSADREKAAKLFNEIKPWLMRRNAEDHTGGQYFRAFDILCAVGPDEAVDTEAQCGNNDWSWGYWCQKTFLPEYSDLMEQHEHGKVYLERDDFKTKVAA